MKEFEYARRKAFAEYFRLAEKSAKESEQPLGDIIKRDFQNHLLPSLKELDEPKIYSLETPYGKLTLDPKSRTATSPFLKEGTTVELRPIESVFLEELIKRPTYVYSLSELALALEKNRNSDLEPNPNIVKWHISHLRGALGIKFSQGKYPLIQTKYGTGFALILETPTILSRG